MANRKDDTVAPRPKSRRKGDPFRVRATILVDGDKVVVEKFALSTVSVKGWLLPTRGQFRRIGAALSEVLRREF